MSLVDRTAAELLADLNAHRLSSVEITQAFIDQIEKLDPKVKAFLRYDANAALAQAKSIDERRAKKHPVGLLAGLPVRRCLLVVVEISQRLAVDLFSHFRE